MIIGIRDSVYQKNQKINIFHLQKLSLHQIESTNLKSTNKSSYFLAFSVVAAVIVFDRYGKYMICHYPENVYDQKPFIGTKAFCFVQSNAIRPLNKGS